MLLAKQISRVTLFLVLVCYLTPSKAQINSPFSRYGLGNEVMNGQNATSQAMGGFSSAFNSTMSGSYGQSVNFNNPASYSQHYMTTFDIAMSLNQTTLKRTNPSAREKSAYLVPNYSAIGVPISKEKKIGFAFGLQPLTSIHYSVNEISNFNGEDTLLNNYRGDGGLNQVFIGIAKGWKYLSIGLNTGYNFGRKDIETYKTISYIPDSSFFYQSKSSTKTSFGGAFLKLGVQGEFPIQTIDRPATKEKNRIHYKLWCNLFFGSNFKSKTRFDKKHWHLHCKYRNPFGYSFECNKSKRGYHASKFSINWCSITQKTSGGKRKL